MADTKEAPVTGGNLQAGGEGAHSRDKTFFCLTTHGPISEGRFKNRGLKDS